MVNLPKISHWMGNDTVETPAGLVVPTRSIDSLVKSEAEKLRKTETEQRNNAAFFSQYALAQNMAVYGAREKPVGTPNFTILYESARLSFIDAILIQARCDQQKRIWQVANSGNTKEVGFKVVHDRHDDKTYKVTPKDQERCREMEDLVKNPTPQEYSDLFPHQVRPHHNLKDLASILARAELIIDRKAILRYKRRDGQGYAAFHWLPGETIKNVDESIRAWARKNEKDKKVGKFTCEKASYATGFDLAKCSHVQMVDGQIVAGFAPDEISVHISNPSDQINRWGYGTSRLELSLDITTTLLLAFTYNREMFKTNYPENILAVAGDFDKSGLAAFKQQILGDAGGVGNNWRLPVIPFDDIEKFKMESIKLRESPKDMLFDQMIELAINLKAAAYGAHPSTLNLAVYAGTSGQNSLGGHNPSDEIEFSKERGLVPSLTDLCEWLTDSIIKPRYPDLKLIIVGLNPEDEKQVVDIRVQKVKAYKTKNEARMEEGDEPIGFFLPLEKYNKLPEGHPDKERWEGNVWNYPADVPITNYMSVFSMAQQQEEQPEDDEDDQGMQKALRKSKQPTAEKKYLKITLN